MANPVWEAPLTKGLGDGICQSSFLEASFELSSSSWTLIRQKRLGLGFVLGFF